MNNVRDFGALGDGIALDTTAIQRALDAGGVAYLPPGQYRSGTLYLRSHGGLELAAGATLLAAVEPENYNADDFDPRNEVFTSEQVSGAHLLIAMDAEEIILRGQGIINGNGEAYFDKSDLLAADSIRPYYRRPAWRPGQMLYFCGCSDVEISGLKLENAPYWNCFLHDCERVKIHDLTIRADRRVINTDGLDLDCCREVEVWNCDIDCGDDAIAVRGNRRPFPGREAPCEHLEVHHCRLGSAACGVRVGVGNGVIRNCEFHHLQIVDSWMGIGICPSFNRKRFVSIEKIRFQNCTFSGGQPLKFIPSWWSGQTATDEAELQSIRDIEIADFCGQGTIGSVICGAHHHDLVNNIRLKRVNLTLIAPETPPEKADWPHPEFGVLNVELLPDFAADEFQGTASSGRSALIQH